MALPFAYHGDLTCSLPVSDRAASMKWYKEVLGFELVYELPEIGWCEMRTPVEGVTIGLSEVESPKAEGGPTLVFGVENIEEARKALEAKGVRFDGPTREIPDCVKLATFFDPDGHKFMFSKNLMAHATT